MKVSGGAIIPQVVTLTPRKRVTPPAAMIDSSPSLKRLRITKEVITLDTSDESDREIGSEEEYWGIYFLEL